MQQTEKYKLNLIETSDTFSPAPLNENIQRLEDIVAAGADAEAKTRADADAALDARVTVLEGHKVVWGSYKGDGSATRTVSLGLTPEYVMIQPGSNVPMTITRSSPYGGFVIQTDGFRVNNSSWNTKDTVYTYLAFL